MTKSHRIGLALGFFILASVGVWVHPYRAQQASRYALTAAIAEHGTVTLDDYVDVLGVDRAVRDGSVYSDKAPGQPFLAVPFYLAYRSVGGQSASVLQIEGNLGLWWQTFWFASIPLAGLAVLMYIDASRVSRLALSGTLSVVFGTLLLPFGTLLFGHVLSAFLVYAGWVRLRRKGSIGAPGLASAGALIGLSVITEYTAVLAGLVVVGYAAWEHRVRVLWLLSGGLPLAGFLMWYNTVAFGGPFTLSYSFSAFSEVTDTARPVTSLFSSFRAMNLFEMLFSLRGFLIATPIVVVALVSAAAMSRDRRWRSEGAIPLLVFALYLLIPLFWANPWGGDSPGARYMIPALPFLVVPASVAWERFRRIAAATTVVSALTMISATLTNPLVPRYRGYGLNVWIRWLLGGEIVPSLASVTLGSSASWIVVPVIAAAAWHLSRCASRVPDP